MVEESAASATRAQSPLERRAGRRVWLGALVILLLGGIMSWVLISSWQDGTRKTIAVELRDQMTQALLESALPTGRMFDGFLGLLGEAPKSSPAEFDVLLRALGSRFVDEDTARYQVRLLSEAELGPSQQAGVPLPPLKQLRNQIARAAAERRALLGPVYRLGERWFATIVGPGPVATGEAPKFVAISFSVSDLTARWRGAGLPENASMALIRPDDRLWWSYPLGPSALEDRQFHSQLVGAQHSEPNIFGWAAPSESRFIHSGRELDAFGLRLIAAIPTEQVELHWRDHHQGSLRVFLAVTFFLACATILASSLIAGEACKRERATAALEQSKRRYRDIVDASSDWFWETGPDNRLTSISSRFEEIAGLPVSEFIGNRREDVFDQEMNSAAARDYMEAIEKRRAFRDFAYPYRGPDGTAHWFKVSGKPVFDADGNFQGYRGACADITKARETEERMTALQARLTRAIEHGPEAFALFDEYGRLTAMNEGFSELFQLPDRELIMPGVHYGDLMVDYAQSGRNLVAQKDPSNWLKQRALMRETETAVDEQLDDGRWIRAREHLTPEGELICVYMDISKDKQREAELLELNEENRRLAAAVEAADVAVVISDPSLDDNPIIFVNPAFSRITGYAAEEAIGRNCRFLQGPESDLDSLRHVGEAVAESRSIEAELLNYRKDGSTFWNLASICPVFDEGGSLRYWVGTLTDITQQKLSEQESVIMKEAAESANRSKSEFLAIISHELRTPLNAIIGFSDILKAEMFGPVGDARYKEYATDIYESGSHLLSMINEILDLSKAEAGKLEIHESRFDLSETIERTISMIRPRADTEGIDFSFDSCCDSVAVVGDERKIKQVLLNLFSNAVKFSADGSEVAVQLEWDGDDCVITVRDQGIGIAEADIPKALEPFGQVDGAHNREHEGTGLGLPLASRLVELHGGRLDVESEFGVGTVVSIRIPGSRVIRQAA